MSDAISREDRKTIFEYARDHWDHHIKNVNYLLVAHGATLVVPEARSNRNTVPQPAWQLVSLA
jgi:hypothetical protein